MRQLKINKMKEATVVDKMTSPSDAAAIAKQEKNTVDAVKSAIDQAKKTGKPVTISEEMLEEGGFLKKLGLPAAMLAGMFLVGQINSSDPEIQRLEAEYKEATTEAEKDSIQDEITKRLIYLDTGKEDIQEKKGKDLDGDGDIDSDDYLAARNAAIKKSIAKKETNEVNTTSPTIGPYAELYKAVYNDWGPESGVFSALGHALYFDRNINKAIKVLKNYDVYDDYKHLLGLNEAKDITLPDDTVFTVDLKHLIQKHGKDNTIKLSKALMKKLHDKGEVSVNGTTITFKPSSKEEIKEEMQTLDIEVPLTNDFGRQDEPNYIDDEGRMAKSQLHKMGEYANKLTAMLDDDTQLEGWVQAKLTKAADYLSAVYHYLDYEMERRGEGETSVEQD